MDEAVLIYNARLLDESVESPGAVLVTGGKIRAVYLGYFTNKKTIEALAATVMAEDGFGSDALCHEYDAKGMTLMPAFIDMHAHFRYPGQTQKEDLSSGLHAAAAGGYGTLVLMPNTTPVISSLDAALSVDEQAASLGMSNVFQTVSITKDFGGADTSHLDALDSARVPVITEDGHDVASAAVMLEAMRKAAERGIIVSCHSEDNALAFAAKPYRITALELMNKYHIPVWGSSEDDIDDIPEDVLDRIEDSLFEANRLLALAEDAATERNIAIAREAGCHVHLAHVSTAASMDAVRAAKAELAERAADDADDEADAAYTAAIDGQKYVPMPAENIGFQVTCEVTPHHPALCGTELPYMYELVNPPLRSEDDRIALLEALRDGTVDVIATDHAPHTAEDKASGAAGFTGLETSYGVCNTVLVKNGQLSAQRLSQLMSANPARLLHLTKGRLAAGYDADLVLADPDEQWTVDCTKFASKGKASPFEGSACFGKVHTLFIAGRKVYTDMQE